METTNKQNQQDEHYELHEHTSSIIGYLRHGMDLGNLEIDAAIPRYLYRVFSPTTGDRLQDYCFLSPAARKDYTTPQRGTEVDRLKALLRTLMWQPHLPEDNQHLPLDYIPFTSSILVALNDVACYRQWNARNPAAKLQILFCVIDTRAPKKFRQGTFIWAQDIVTRLNNLGHLSLNSFNGDESYLDESLRGDKDDEVIYRHNFEAIYVVTRKLDIRDCSSVRDASFMMDLGLQTVVPDLFNRKSNIHAVRLWRKRYLSDPNDTETVDYITEEEADAALGFASVFGGVWFIPMFAAILSLKCRDAKDRMLIEFCNREILFRGTPMPFGGRGWPPKPYLYADRARKPPRGVPELRVFQIIMEAAFGQLLSAKQNE